MTFARSFRLLVLSCRCNFTGEVSHCHGSRVPFRPGNCVPVAHGSVRGRCVFDLPLLIVQQAVLRQYLEFLRIPALSTGLYLLPVGTADLQQPHTEDEVYYVVRGCGQIRVATEDRPVEAGTLVYVPAGMEHHISHNQRGPGHACPLRPCRTHPYTAPSH